MLQIAPELTIVIDPAIYPKTALFRCCYLFTDRCWIWLTPSTNDNISIHFVRKSSGDDLRALQGEFANALIDHVVRWQVDQETRAIRQVIITAALGEAAHA